MEAITAFMESFDISALLPELGKFISDIRFWVGLFMLIGPIVMLGLGLWYYFLPTKEANHYIGFRTYFGMGSREAWSYAQKWAGWFFMIGGGALAVVSLVFVIIFGGMDAMKMATTAFYVLVGQAVVALGLWITLQIMLIRRYDKDGNLKVKK